MNDGGSTGPGRTMDRQWRTPGVQGALGLLAMLAGLAGLIAATEGVASADTVVHPVITQTDAIFVLPISDITTPVGTTWRLNLWDNTTKQLVATMASVLVPEESAISIDVKVPSTPTCYFQADIRFTMPGLASTLGSGTYYSGDIATVPGCGSVPSTTTTTTTLGTTITTTTNPSSPTTTIPSSPTTTNPSSPTTTSPGSTTTTKPTGGTGSGTPPPGGGSSGSSVQSTNSALPFTDGSTQPKGTLTALLAFTGSNIPLLAGVGACLTGFGLLLLRRRALHVAPTGVIVAPPDLHDEW